MSGFTPGVLEATEAGDVCPDCALIPVGMEGEGGALCPFHAAAPALLAIATTLFNRWSNTEPGSPHRIIDDDDARLLRAAIEKAKVRP